MNGKIGLSVLVLVVMKFIGSGVIYAAGNDNSEDEVCYTEELYNEYTKVYKE